MNPNEPSLPASRSGLDTKAAIFILLAPALLTCVVGLFQSAEVTIFIVWAGSLAAGLVSATILARNLKQPVWLRILIGLVLAGVFFVLSVVLCFMACSLTNGGGVRY